MQPYKPAFPFLAQIGTGRTSPNRCLLRQSLWKESARTKHRRAFQNYMATHSNLCIHTFCIRSVENNMINQNTLHSKWSKEHRVSIQELDGALEFLPPWHLQHEASRASGKRFSATSWQLKGVTAIACCKSKNDINSKSDMQQMCTQDSGYSSHMTQLWRIELCLD